MDQAWSMREESRTRPSFFSLNTWKDRIATELGRLGVNRCRGENKEFSSGHNFVSTGYMEKSAQPGGYGC